MHVLYAAYCLEISFVAGGCNNSLLANLNMKCLPCIDIKTGIKYFIQGYVHNNVPLCLQGADVFSANIAGWKHLPSSAQPSLLP